MIYSYTKVVTEGPAGTVLDFHYNPEVVEGEERPADPTTYLGELDGVCYRHVPDDVTLEELGPQEEEINLQQATLTAEQKTALRQQSLAVFYKESLRRAIDQNVGDLPDILADMSKLCEFSIVAVCTLLADKAGIAPMSAETAQTYGERAAFVLQSIQNGSLTIRGSFENPNDMIAKILPSYSKLQQLVHTEYLAKLEAIGL